MQTAIVVAAIIGALVSLAIYIGLSVTFVILALRKSRVEDQPAGDGAAKVKPIAFVNPAEFVEAIGKLVEALAKAGPALWALIGSMLFLLIAAFAAGLFPG
jgi:hypothetical protein